MLKATKTSERCDFILDHKDYGIGVCITIKGFEFTDEDEVVITISEREVDRPVIIEKHYGNKDIKDNSFCFMLNEEESNKLTSDIYSLDMKIYRKNKFLLTVAQSQNFLVEGGI